MPPVAKMVLMRVVRVGGCIVCDGLGVSLVRYHATILDGGCRTACSAFVGVGCVP